METKTETETTKKPTTFVEHCVDLGIEFVKTPEQQAHAGLFELPPNFPKGRLSAEWVPEDQVRYKEQRAPMIGVGAMVPGLTIWRGEDGKSKPEKRYAGGSKTFVLMVRPKRLQMAMNALYGNVSKRYYNSTLKGESLGLDNNGNEIQLQDPGMLSEERLKEAIGPTNLEESLMSLNNMPEPEQAVEVST